jgi:hypothetical protein
LIQEHNERTGHFVRACGAFAYITIPAISCPMIRFRLYLLSSQVALANECLGQADACLEGAINLVTEFSPTEEQWIVANLSNLLSTLLVQPVRPYFIVIYDENDACKCAILLRTRPIKIDFTIYGVCCATHGHFPLTTRCIGYVLQSTFKRFVYFPPTCNPTTSTMFQMVGCHLDLTQNIFLGFESFAHSPC